jgi:hypothetical protein
LVALLKIILISFLPGFINVILVAGGFVWSTYSSVGFIKQMIPDDRKGLAVYPVFLFYLFLSWFILL